MIERDLSIQISIESVKIISLFFIDGTLDSLIIYNMNKNSAECGVSPTCPFS